MTKNKKNFFTLAVHAGQKTDPLTGAVMTPIYATSTFKQISPGKHYGFEYARTQNPTRFSFENAVAELESAKNGYAFSSGLAACSSVLELLPANSEMLAIDDLYGGSWRLFEKVRKTSMGLKVLYANPNIKNDIESKISKKTKMIWIETPSNPLLKITDLKKIAEIAKRLKIITVVDNTFASPIVQSPLKFGIDIVVHSATKYINGHSDVIGGCVITNNKKIANKIEFLQNSVGSILDPFSSFLALRGIKTLSLRMQQHSVNALKIAKYLHNHPKISKTIYPGLATHPQYQIAKKQMNKMFGGMISFYLNSDSKGTRRFLRNLKIFTLAESLGGVESLISHPLSMSHASFPIEILKKNNISDNLIRLSVGIENGEDLIIDLENALKKI